MTEDPPESPGSPPLDAGVQVDGARLLRHSVRFVEALRGAGLRAPAAATVDFVRALTLVGLADRELVRAAGAAVFVRGPDERAIHDGVFERWWCGRLAAAGPPTALAPPAPSTAREDVERRESGEPERVPRGAVPTPLVASPEDGPAPPVDDPAIARHDAYSADEWVRHRPFDAMTAAEWREAERLVDRLEVSMPRRRRRRYRLHPHGRRLAPRSMLRRSIGTAGELLDRRWQRRVEEPRRIVVLCDISGSMERHARLLLRFIAALAASDAVQVEAFVFGTRLTRVTRLLREPDRDAALDRVAEAVFDWAGGTRIGEAFQEFHRRWARRTLRSSAIVIVISDGWDRGDPEAVGDGTARLRRRCHRLIWLNPLAGSPGYRPLAGGMRAAYPHLDAFLPAGRVADLERFAQVLAEAEGWARGRRPRTAAALDAVAGSSAGSAAPRYGPSRGRA